MNPVQKKGRDWVRLCIHVPNGPLAVLFLQVLQVSRPVALAIFGAVTFALLFLDGLRIIFYYLSRRPQNRTGWWSKEFRAFYAWCEGWLFATTLKEKERGMFSAGPTYALGIVVVFALFEYHILVPSIMFLALGDPAARFVGKRLGKPRRWLFGKSIEGCLAFFAAACIGAALINIVGYEWRLYPPTVSNGQILLAQLAGVAVAMIAEAYSPWFDNFTIPVAAAAAMWLVL